MDATPGPGGAARPSPVLHELDAALTRIGVRTPLARDAVLAGLVALASVAILVPALGPVAARLGLEFVPAERATLLVLVAVQAMVLVLRRVRPTACLLGVAVLQVALSAVLPFDTNIRMAAVVIAAYSVGAHRPPRAALRAVVAAVAVEVLGGLFTAAAIRPTVRELLTGSAAGGPAWSSLVPAWLLAQVFVVLLYVGATLAGMVVASRRRYSALVQEQLDAAAAQEQGRVRAAVASERTRMARELHDIAAHHLSGLVVQAAAVERLVDRDPEAAKRATRAVRAQGKEALANLRAVVGVLREAADGELPAAGLAGLDAEAGAPVPGLAVVDRLFDAARSSGDDLEVTLPDVAAVLPPAADVTVYRVLQEALANARQHAPGRRVRVVLAQEPSQLRLEVSNPLPEPVPGVAHRAGYGLVGMRERAQLSGAVLEAGPVGSSWRVRLLVPWPAGSVRPSPGTGVRA